MLHCQGCHRPDGSGIPGAVPAFPGQVAKFLATPTGRAFLVRVPGAANAPISDDELAALLDWIVRRFDAANVPADFTGFTGAYGNPSVMGHQDSVSSVRALDSS